MDNTAIKISGLGMFDQSWTTDSIRPIVLDCIETFGIDRCFFATNFPVDKLFSSYEKVWKSYFEITQNFLKKKIISYFLKMRRSSIEFEFVV